jgi:tetratricopeptide (TPR) repeat protein
VIDDCNAVLKVDADNSKAHFRRGKAYLALNDLDRAQDDLQRADQLSPNDSAVRAELTQLRKKQQAADKKQAAVYAGMFARMQSENTTATATTPTTTTTTAADSTQQHTSTS